MDLPPSGLRQAVESKVKDWLDPSGQISLEKTIELIKYLRDKDQSLVGYAFWKLNDYVRHFGLSESAITFGAWFTLRFGEEKALELSGLADFVLSDRSQPKIIEDESNEWLQVKPYSRCCQCSI
jgi:hypothetical protein